MEKTFIDFMSERLRKGKTSHQQRPDRIFFEVPADIGLTKVSIRTAGEFTVCVAGVEQSIPTDQIGRVAELVNRMNREFGPGSLVADFDDPMITCRTGVPFGLIRNDDRVASLLLGTTIGGLASAVRAVRAVIDGDGMAEVMHRWRTEPMPVIFTLPGMPGATGIADTKEK